MRKSGLRPGSQKNVLSYTTHIQNFFQNLYIFSAVRDKQTHTIQRQKQQ